MDMLKMRSRGKIPRNMALLQPFSRELVVRPYRISSQKLTSPLKIVLVTDLHGIRYGEKQGVLLEAARKCSPDLMVFAGDIVEKDAAFGGVRDLFSQAPSLCPCFYVTGNHEFQTGRVPVLKRWLRESGVLVLDGSVETVTIRGQRIQVGGVDDPHRFTHSPHAIRLREGWKRQLAACRAGLDPALFSILLTHRPELVRYYRCSGFDLVVAGHAHGGQVRIPGLCNGLFAPHQGFFPRYGGGCYRLEGKAAVPGLPQPGAVTMVVSRGLCLNHLPRIFNPPELVSIRVEPEPETSASLSCRR